MKTLSFVTTTAGCIPASLSQKRIKKETYAKRSSANVSEEEDARMTKDNGLSSIAKRKEQLEKENEQTGPKTTFT